MMVSLRSILCESNKEEAIGEQGNKIKGIREGEGEEEGDICDDEEKSDEEGDLFSLPVYISIR